MFTLHKMNPLAFERSFLSISEAKALLNFPLQCGCVSFTSKQLVLCDGRYPEEAIFESLYPMALGSA